MKRLVAIFAAMTIAGALAGRAMAQGYNSDITQTEIANFNNYLNSHPAVAQRLASNPSLINDPQFIANHPGLHTFLQNYPGVREEIHESPGQFMYREGRYEWNHGITPQGGITGGEVARFDNGYLDEHPEVARQLAADPHLVDNPQYLANHPGLDKYLAAHPGIRTELIEHPNRFMYDERRYEHYEDHAHPLANTDHYLDGHPEVAEQLQKDPALVDNPKYVASHPRLHEFLRTHPVARSEWKSHPYRFMNRENRYDKNH